MENFWKKSKKPIYALAPMAGYTDSAFRQICKSFGADVVYSEMASAAALCHAPAKTLELLGFSETERPYVAQLFGADPEDFAVAAKMISKKGVPVISGILSSRHASGLQDDSMARPDGLDINFGCPVKKVAKQGAGAVLMNDKKRAREIVKAVVANSGLPVSIKIRARAGETDALRFLDYLKDLDIKAVMIHGRTLAQGFSGPVDSAIIKKARGYFGGVILANGGVTDHESGAKLLDASAADGLGLARGALGRPWLFKVLRTGQSPVRSPRAEFKIAIKHAELIHATKGEYGLIEARKHFCAYVQGLPGAKKLRERLVKAANLPEIKALFQETIWGVKKIKRPSRT